MGSIKKAPQWINLIMIIGFLLLVWLLIYGNLSGNLGFAANSQGYNDTQAVINNFSQGAVTLSGYAVTWFTIIGVVLLVLFVLVLLVVVMKFGGGKKSGGYTSM